MDVERMTSELKKGVNMHGKPFSAATIRHMLILLNHLFNVARKWDIHDGKNPVGNVQRPKLDNQTAGSVEGAGHSATRKEAS
jgi:hypothetical protein